jgi:hypothetical protein
VCMNCGRPLTPRHGSRRQRFCGSICRKSANRAKKWAARYPTLGAGRSVQNNLVASTPYKASFAVRPGGISGPRDVIERAMVGGRVWHEEISPDGVVVQVARFWRAP